MGLGGAGGEATFGSFSAHRKLRLKMAKPGALVAAAAALVAIARAQQASQCTPQYLHSMQVRQIAPLRARLPCVGLHSSDILRVGSPAAAQPRWYGDYPRGTAGYAHGGRAAAYDHA